MKLFNTLFNKALISEQVKRFWIIAALPALLYMIFIIFPIYNARSGIGWFLADLLTMQNSAVLIAMILVPFCIIMALFPYYFSNKASGFYSSLPLTKLQLFCSNFVTGLILMIFPLVLLTLILFIPVWDSFSFISHRIYEIYGGEVIAHQPFIVNPPSMVVRFFVMAVTGFVFYYSLFLVAVSLAGSRVIGILLIIFLPFLPLGLVGLWHIIANVYVFGFTVFDDMIYHYLLLYTHPVLWALVPVGETLRFFAVYIGLTLVFLGLSYYLSCIRKQERTEDSVVFAPVKALCIFLVAFIGMLILGVFIMLLTQSRGGLYIGFVIGFAIAYCIGQMIAEQSFYISHKIKKLPVYGGIMAGLYLTMLVITTFGMGFYVNRIPVDPAAVGISHHRHLWHRRDIFIDDPYIIEAVTEIHRHILDNRGELRAVFWNDLSGARWAQYSIHIRYLLEDGSVIRRFYILSHDFAERHGIEDLLMQPAILLAPYDFIREPHTIRTLELHIHQSIFNEAGYIWEHRNETLILRDVSTIENIIEMLVEEYVQGRRPPVAELINETNHISVNITTFRDGAERVTWWGLGNVSPGFIAWLVESGYLHEGFE